MFPPTSKVQSSAAGVESEVIGEQQRSFPATPSDIWFNDRIKILNRDAMEASPAQRVYRIASAIIGLIRVSALVLFPPVHPQDLTGSPIRTN